MPMTVRPGSGSAFDPQILPKIGRIQLAGFGFVFALIWLDELVDLPHILFGDPPTPVRLTEIAVESVGVLILAGVARLITSRILRRLAYLERFVVLCAWCRRVRLDDKWVTFEAFLGEHSAETSHGMCPKCEQKVTA
jgi:hypothetical protein